MKIYNLKSKVFGLFSLLLLATSLLSPSQMAYANSPREVSYVPLGENCYKVVTRDGELIKIKRVSNSRCE